MATKKKSAVGSLKDAAKKKVAAPVKAQEPPKAPEPPRVSQEEAEKLKNFNNLLTMKRLELATQVEQLFFSLDQVSSVRTSRMQFLHNLTEKYQVDTSRQWAISPEDLSIYYPEQA